MDERDVPGQPEKSQPSFIPTSRKAAEPPPVLEDLDHEPPATTQASSLPEPQPDDRIDWLAPFENRLIIAGLSVLVLLALTAAVLLVFSQGSGNPVTANVGVIATDDGATPEPIADLMAEALETTTLFNGPGETFSPLGTVPRGARVAIVGRNETSTWLQVAYPPGSPLRGWVDVELFSVTGSLDGVAIAGPGESPDIEAPTSPPVFFEEPTDTPVLIVDPTDTPEPEPTDTPEDATDTPAAPTNAPAAPTEPPADTPAPQPTTAGEGE